MRNTRAVLGMVLLSVLAFCACRTYAQQTAEFRERVKECYDFANWGGRTQTNYVRLVTNWVPDLATLSITNCLISDIDTNGIFSSRFDFLATNDPSVMIIVRAHQLLSVSNAHETMLSCFTEGAFSVCPTVVGKGAGVDIGDRCYLNNGTNENFICFVRNNIMLQVQANRSQEDDGPAWERGIHYTNRYSVFDLARALDQQILKISVSK